MPHRIESPLIKPDPSIPAMSKNAFNCGVVYNPKKQGFKMLIRGAYTPKQELSDLLYAESSDGYHFEIDPNPVLVHGVNEWAEYTQGGIEDPRIVRWNNSYYIFATARFEKRKVRVGIWKTKNLGNPSSYKWVGIPWDKNDKNASIISEPIDGKVYLIDRLLPHIWISHTKDFSLNSGWRDHRILMRKKEAYPSPLSGVEPHKIGLAGPPLKNKFGWLTFIHVVHKERNQWNRAYSLSFILLDPKNPMRVRYIHPKPILWPERGWEIYGTVPYVVFSCANCRIDDEIWLYYGGADTVIGLAKFKEDEILSLLERNCQ
jgi:predicted GH43/DUF377 family glycosyl hydrolase